MPLRLLDDELLRVLGQHTVHDAVASIGPVVELLAVILVTARPVTMAPLCALVERSDEGHVAALARVDLLVVHERREFRLVRDMTSIVGLALGIPSGRKDGV